MNVNHYCFFFSSGLSQNIRLRWKAGLFGFNLLSSVCEVHLVSGMEPVGHWVAVVTGSRVGEAIINDGCNLLAVGFLNSFLQSLLVEDAQKKSSKLFSCC